MPLQSWAGARTCGVGTAAPAAWAQPDSCTGVAQAVPHASGAAIAMPDLPDAMDAMDLASAGGATEPGGDSPALDPSPSGADLAESLLPAAPLRFAAGAGRSAAPTHRAGTLPDPDLPLQQRPPSA